ncbi:MAG: alginate export family protein [Chitinophagaceae bacterium]
MRAGITALFSCCVIATLARQVPALPPPGDGKVCADTGPDSGDAKVSRFKYLPLFGDSVSFISLGGEARWQYFISHNEKWGDAAFDNDQYILQRYLLHADLHTGKYIRFFVQAQSSLALRRKEPGPIEHNPLEMHQFFIEWTLSGGKRLQLGRQEWLYGSQRLMGVREGPNSRLSFDAAKFSWKKTQQQLDLFYGRPVINRRHLLNDRSSADLAIWGLYVVENNIRFLNNFDFYYLGYSRNNSVYDLAVGRELRHSAGIRVWRDDGSWTYDLEALYQWGRLDSWKIRAWTISANISYRFDNCIWKPQPGLKAELISGDQDRDDGRLGSFNAMFPRGAYFGLAALIGPSNLADWHPSLLLSPGENWQMGIDWDLFWRFSKNDGLYATNGAILYSGRNVSGNFIGSQVSFNLSRKWKHRIESNLEFTWFNAGAFLKEAGKGRDILFAGVTFQVKY